MAKKLILMVDNHVDFLDTRAEYVEQAGYRVIKAYNAEDARTLTETVNPDLAVVDVRLVNDFDSDDRTGVFLADTLRNTCPVIILTDHAKYEVVRQTLKPDEEGRPLAVDFVDKHEGPAELIQAIGRALNQTNNPQKRGGATKNFWRTIRIAVFVGLAITIFVTIILAFNNLTAATIIGIIFSGLQVLVGIGSWFFERRN